MLPEDQEPARKIPGGFLFNKLLEEPALFNFLFTLITPLVPLIGAERMNYVICALAAFKYF